MHSAFLQDNTKLLVGNRPRAERCLEQWLDNLQRSEGEPWHAAAQTLVESTDSQLLLEVIFGNSPHLSACALADPGFTAMLFEKGPPALDASNARLVNEVEQAENQVAVMRALRQAKRRMALAVGVIDITAAQPLELITAALSDFAELALDIALTFLLRQAAQRGELEFQEGEDPLSSVGYFLLGMGKLGAKELNYSSDIDLIAIYDPQKAPLTGKRDHQDLFVRLTRDVARIMDERTADGHVFRTDFRLRPDPAAMPLALTYLAAETYYESLGQNWERAAMIKARTVAGDRKLGAEFLRSLRPFVWRRNLDFWAIQDIHSIKRQIHAAKGGKEIAVEGHNIKLGRGGIREIEFFVQTQQLIYGGRDPTLRTSQTLEGLQLLAANRRIEPKTAEDMTQAYRELRRIEHRLQMIEDQQTHSIPTQPEALAEVAAFLGFDEVAAFRRHLIAILETVERYYAALFEESADLAERGNLVFTGGEPDPDTMTTLTDMGFSDGERVYNLVKGWHHGRYRALRATRARQILTEIMPTLLQELADTPDPDESILRFDAFMQGLPAGVQLFSMIHANPSLLDLLAEVMGSAPLLAEHLSRRPGLLDAVLSGDFFDAVPDTEALRTELSAHLEQARDFEDVLELSRQWANDRKFQVGVQLLRQACGNEEAARALSDIAEVTIGALHHAVARQISTQHGTASQAGMAVVALGKLGAREMTPTSDLDLVFLYDADSNHPSDGAKPLAASQYYARLGQRLITAVSAMTGEGRLYEIDMRLRPSGNKGPLALTLDGFRRYQTSEAWTWEHMALTRARVVSADAELGERISQTIREILTAPRDNDRLLADVASMRERMAKEHTAKTPWSIKHWRGGIVDLEFLTQYLLLRHCAERPDILTGNTPEALRKLAEAGFLDPTDAENLCEAGGLLLTLQSLLRLTLKGELDEETAPQGLKDVLARAGGALDFDALRDKLKAANDLVLSSYMSFIGDPAKALAPETQT